MNIKAIVGLGNPGSRYNATRHNIGFCIVDALAEKYGAAWKTTGIVSHCVISLENIEKTSSIVVIKPQTYMNNSGDIAPFLKKHSIQVDEVLVVHDELEKKFGSYSIKQGGSARGHNGLRSLIARVGDSFWRFRFGIDRPENKEEVPHYVLAPFSKQEQEQLPALVEEAVHAIEVSLLTTSD